MARIERVLVLLPALLMARGAVAQTPVARGSVSQATITFEELALQADARHQYANKGVRFPYGTTIWTHANPHSGKKVLYAERGEVYFFPGPLTIVFDAGQISVSLFAGTAGDSAESATLTAFDAYGRVLMRDGPKRVTPGAFATQLEVRSAQPVIRRVELLYANDHREVIDDLTITVSAGGGTNAAQHSFVAVPSVVRRTLAAAQELLHGRRLRLGRVSLSDAANLPTGIVADQTPLPGNRVPRNSAVDVVIATDSTTVPLLRGRTIDQTRA